MPERIYKLQPDRTMALRGFDGLGASAALHSATPESFKVSGVFRDPADFAVLMLWDADNFYEHPRLKYLPDFEFGGLTLEYDVHYSGLMPLDSPKYPTIDWPFLDVVKADGSTARIRLYHPDPAQSHATVVSGTRTCASGAFLIQATGDISRYDRITVWYQNLAFDYVVPEIECSFRCTGGAPGTAHTVTVANVAYTYVQTAGDTDTSIATGVINALAACPQVTAQRDAVDPAQVNLRSRLDDGAAYEVRYGALTFPMNGVGPHSAALAIAAQINAVNWSATGALIPLSAQANGPMLEITAQTPGPDGNMISLYAIWKNDRLKADRAFTALSGGSSDVTWRVRLDFAALGIPQIRQMWLTFAPALANGAAFEAQEWEAAFTNWHVTGPPALRELKVAGPGSVRVEENDPWCKYTGAWADESGFFSQGMARRAVTSGAEVTVKYACSFVHDLYLGTSLYSDRGRVSVSLDGDTATVLDTRLTATEQVNTRRRVRTAVAAGEHRVTLRLLDNAPFYFDFLEAAVASDVPDALAPNPRISPALDYSTDHTYKLPPARILWMFDKLGFAGTMNEYIGVFWWNQRRASGTVMPQAQVTFTGTFAPGDGVFLRIGDAEIGKTVFPADTNVTIARHFAQFLNSYSVAVWASAEDNVLTITSRSAKPAYLFPLSVRKEPASGSTGAWSITGSLDSGNPGEWVVDPSQSPALNRGARDWHADLFRECAARGREIFVSSSMELVNPPAEFASVFLDGQPVVTDVGFGSWKSTHCAFTAAVLEYQKSVYLCLAGLMDAAGVRPSLQCGEYLWWFFSNRTAANPSGGMGFYHPEITAAAAAALGRPLHGFTGPDDDPGVNGSADASFLRARLRDHVQAIITGVRSAYPTARFEVLFPYDVNHPHPAGINNRGGRLNRFINFPLEWGAQATAGFDRLKMEALDFGAWSRNLDLARTAIQFPLDMGWPAESVAHLVPIFRPGYPWEKEVAFALAAGFPVVNLWAYDHVCIYGYPVETKASGRAAFMGRA